MTKVPNFQGG